MSLITDLNRCKGILHDFHVDKQNGELLDYKDVKIERCTICGKKIRWNKDSKGRVDNKEYLEAHLRDFLQRTGPTAKLFYSIYKPEEYEANKYKWMINV